ncbi:uncharacterized protein LOC131934815 [Physella acuta]|uniref:uncharacterized protein LOC131934815 n=1 Tax=Physella acuta TaxID=109671 RepID=UPI0027DE5C37|nr:uncharacterized protein LOC131934815 [Physella acuta]
METNVTKSLPNSVLQENFSFEVTVLCMCRGVVSFLGLIGDFLTIWTFLAMGPKDGVTLSFLLLSVSDILYLLCMTISSISYIFISIELMTSFKIYFPVDPYGIKTYISNCGGDFYASTMLTLTFLSICRCLSVAKPLWFRHKLGTKRISVMFFSISAAFCLGTSVPILALMGIIPLYDARINTTRPSLWISPERKWVTYIVWPVRGSLLPLIVQVILIITSVVMTRFLKSALTFRQKHTSSYLASTQSALFKIDDTTNNDKSFSKEKNKLSGKQLQIIKQMIILSVVFIVSCTPKMMFNAAVFIYPEFSINGKYGRLYETVSAVREAFQMLYSCSNVFIYYTYNSKFRDMFRRKFARII